MRGGCNIHLSPFNVSEHKISTYNTNKIRSVSNGDRNNVVPTSSVKEKNQSHGGGRVLEKYGCLPIEQIE
uniref:Uncharacterized protein n=1 Tax=Tanacetum cinerariifolium TaxID=118510 RepID=A0A6L2NYP2_TANCI|nr:hypothetical protein [Tanacetum cinerariifolium]